MIDLSNRLRDRASELSDVGFFATAHEMRQAAAEIAELTELVEAQKQEILDLHDIRDQRDEWRWRAELMHSAMDHVHYPRKAFYTVWSVFLSDQPEAAQWFEE